MTEGKPRRNFSSPWVLVYPSVMSRRPAPFIARTTSHLANAAIRTGRKLKFDPVAQRFVGDEEANRLVDQPMRAPWHL